VAGDDWAVVVGIKNYADPDLAGLQGPENDAREFYDWVVSATGGAVPEAQAKLILSSDYPPFTTVANAMPTADVIKHAFDHLRSLADENENKGLGRNVGRRLCLFFSGHGFAPSQHDELAALLTAEASVAGAQLTHIVGSYMADFFWRARYFEEILLFMDCCRSVMECAQLYKPYEDERATDFYQVRKFYAYGARVAKESREWQMGDGRYHGVFTRTLVDALSGTGYDPGDASIITAESLRDQLYNGFKKFMSPSDQKRPDLPKEPEVVYEQKPGGNFTIVTRANLVQRMLGLKTVPKYEVKLLVSPARIGKKATVRDKSLGALKEETLGAGTTLQLERGFYVIEIAGEPEPITFEVTGAGDEVHV
jgi:hypothetical protein